MRLLVLSFTEKGSHLNRQLCLQMSQMGYFCEGYAPSKYAKCADLKTLDRDISEWIGENWGNAAFLFIGAAGIAVRMIAPWVKDKFTDSPVLVMDEKGTYIIPLLSGHVGGAVQIAHDIAEVTGAIPVITTATDVQKKFAVDVFAVKNHLLISDREKAKQISASVLRGEKIEFECDFPIEGDVPEELSLSSGEKMETEDRKDKRAANFRIAVRQFYDSCDEKNENTLFLYPKNVIIGIGCRKGVPAEQLKEGMDKILQDLRLKREQVEAVVSIDLKKEEAGILEMTDEWKIPFYTFSAEELKTVKSVSTSSEFVSRITGVDNVCERAVKYYCPDGELILPKTSLEQMTFAVVCRKMKLSY